MSKDFVHFISIYQFFLKSGVIIIIFDFYEEKYMRGHRNKMIQSDSFENFYSHLRLEK